MNSLCFYLYKGYFFKHRVVDSDIFSLPVNNSWFFYVYSHLLWFQCNNPMTKEPKLQAAVRIVSEWTDYDQEIKRLQTRVQEGANHRTKQQGTGNEHAQPVSADTAWTLITTTNVSLLLCLSARCSQRVVISGMRRWTGLCLKSLFHEEAPLMPWGLLTAWPQTTAKLLKHFPFCFFLFVCFFKES